MSQMELIVVGGPNGAGKSTFAAAYLAERPCPYLCADLIATEFQHLEPMSRQIAAGREFLSRSVEQLAKMDDFIIESTLSGKTLRSFLRKGREAGYSITIIFVYLDSADTCVARVRQRVRRGGHNVPEDDIRRRFNRSCANFWHAYRKIADQWLMVYNAGEGFDEFAFGFADEFVVSNDDMFSRFLEFAELKK